MQTLTALLPQALIDTPTTKWNKRVSCLHTFSNVLTSTRFLSSLSHVHLLLNPFRHAPGRSSPSVLCPLLECLRNIQDFKATPSIRPAGWPTERPRHNPEEEGSKRLFGCLGCLGNAERMHYSSQRLI